MTANNCECSSGKVWYTQRGATEVCPDCREARAGLFGPAVTALERCGEEIKMRDERIEQLDRELTKLSESEAKAWGLVAHLVPALESADAGFAEFTNFTESARTALAARKAGQ